MNQSWDLVSFEGRPDWPVWLVLAGTSAFLIGATVASSLNYTSIVVSQASVTIGPTTTPNLIGTYPNGSLRSDGSLSLNLALRVNNPSERMLRLHLVAFSGWIEDGPAESGLNETRRLSDDRYIDVSGTRYFLQVIGESKEISVAPIPPLGDVTYPFSYNVSGATNPTTFAAIRNITDFWASTRGEVPAGAWVSWVRVQLDISDVPPATSPFAAPYLRTIGRIEREVGINLAG